MGILLMLDFVLFPSCEYYLCRQWFSRVFRRVCEICVMEILFTEQFSCPLFLTPDICPIVGTGLLQLRIQ
jgi:hypothetical protein